MHWLPYRQDGTGDDGARLLSIIYIFIYVVFCVDGTGDSNAIVSSTGLSPFTTIQQMTTLHQPSKTTNPNPKP